MDWINFKNLYRFNELRRNKMKVRIKPTKKYIKIYIDGVEVVRSWFDYNWNMETRESMIDDIVSDFLRLQEIRKMNKNSQIRKFMFNRIYRIIQKTNF